MREQVSLLPAGFPRRARWHRTPGACPPRCAPARGPPGPPRSPAARRSPQGAPSLSLSSRLRFPSLAFLRGRGGGAGAARGQPEALARPQGNWSAPGTAGGKGRGCPSGRWSPPHPPEPEGDPGVRAATEAPSLAARLGPAAPSPRLRPLISGGPAARSPPAANYPPRWL